jgi:hypothetical protein
MTVHKVDHRKDTVATCGVSIAKHLRGLDACDTWNPKVGNPVSCPDCILFHKPFARKVPTWEGIGRKVR